jgi:hypothetical protein
MTCFALSILSALLAPSLKAQGPSPCIEELALPGFGGFLKVPTAVDIDFTIGPDGKAAESRFTTSDGMMLA